MASSYRLALWRKMEVSSARAARRRQESSYILRRWYGDSAALEETCSSTQTVNGESRAVIQGKDSPQLVDVQKSSKEIPSANAAVKQECAAKEPSSALNTDKLSLIMEKIRSKNNPHAPKDNGAPLQASLKANQLPEGSIKNDDRWKQIVRGMTAKLGRNLASGGAKPNLAKSGEGVNQDDFADLDLPRAQDDDVPSKASSKSTSFARTDALRNLTPNVKPKETETQGLNGNQKANDLTPNVKPKETEMQGLNGNQKANGFQGYQQKAKEAKPTSFRFLRSPDAPTWAGGEDESGDSFSLKDLEWLKTSPKTLESPSSEDDFSTLRESLTPKTLKPPKTSESPNEFVYEAKSGSSHEVKSVFPHEAKHTLPRELQRAFAEEKERALSYAQEVTGVIKRTIYPGYTVCIQNLPSESNLGLLKEALSLHGEVVSSFKISNSDGSCNAFVEFKTPEAVDGALASRWLSLDSKAFSMVRANPPITTVVRLSRVSAETTDDQLASVCEKFGSLDHIQRRGNGVYDVYYNANELPNMPTVLDSLNEVTLNQRRLGALPAPLLVPAMRKEVLKRSEGQSWHASQLSQTLSRIETGLDTVSICFEDLKSLTAMEDEFSKPL